MPKALLAGYDASNRREDGGNSINGSAVASGSGKQVEMTEEEFDLEHHKRIRRQRNFDKVYFDHKMIQTWQAHFQVLTRSMTQLVHRYYSPYPLTKSEEAPQVPPQQRSRSSSPPRRNAPKVNKMRTLDLMAGGLPKSNGPAKANIHVCSLCFKYTTDIPTNAWEKHEVSHKFLLTALPSHGVILSAFMQSQKASGETGV